MRQVVLTPAASISLDFPLHSSRVWAARPAGTCSGRAAAFARPPMSIATLLLSLLSIFAAAKLFGEIAERIGQPAVLGEMIGGIVIGVSGLHLIDAHDPVLHLLSELGVVLLLFLIGLETDLHRLL
ncbi:MAG: cation:proton antiporter, partial [Thermoanaerobaculia bacterium]